jgi:hypothetical protein
MKLPTLLLSALSLAALGLAAPPTITASFPLTSLLPAPPQTSSSPPLSTITTVRPTAQATPAPTPTTIPYTTLVTCETIITTRAPCRTVTSHCVFPASTTASYTILLNGTTTSGIVCIPTAHLSTSWPPLETRTWWTKQRPQTTGTAQMLASAANGPQNMDPRVPPPERLASRSVSWHCTPPFCFGRPGRTSMGTPRETRVPGIPPAAWFATRFPGGVVRDAVPRRLCRDELSYWGCRAYG